MKYEEINQNVTRIVAATESIFNSEIDGLKMWQVNEILKQIVKLREVTLAIEEILEGRFPEK